MLKSIAIFSTIIVGAWSGALFAGVKVDICHYDADLDVHEVINVSANAIQKHLDNHGDTVVQPFITVNDAPIWSNDQAQGGVCASRCDAEDGTFTGAWWTTVPGEHSVCVCIPISECDT